MANIIIVYQSQTGFTQQFALWLAKALHAELIDLHFVTTKDLLQCELVIYGGHVVNHQVAGFARFSKQFAGVLPSGVILFGTGVMPLSNREAQRVRARSLRFCPKRAPEFFYLRGRLNTAQLPLRLRLRSQLQGGAKSGQDSAEIVQPVLDAVRRRDLW